MTRTTPTFVAEYESAWNTSGGTKTVTPTISPGDVLVIGGMTANDTTNINTPTDNLGTHLTYTLQQSIVLTDYCVLKLWTAVVGAQSGSFTLSMSPTTGVDDYGMNCLRFSGVNSIGNSNKANAEVSSGGQNLSFTTSAENSLVVCFAADWTADPGSPAWRTVNGFQPNTTNGARVTWQSISAVYAVHGAYYVDTGAAGTNAYGASTPVDQKYSIAAVELVGPTVGGGPAPFNAGFFDGI
jgi:hypothetical protein